MNIIKDDYNSKTKVYEIVKPAIESGDTYFFTTDSEMEYEVRFGRKKENYMGHIVNFSVLNDEFDDEYSETNKGELYSVIATVVEIIRLFHQNHEYSDTFEFSGEFKEDEEGEVSIRTRLYHRIAKQVISEEWNIEQCGNKVVISKPH